MSCLLGSLPDSQWTKYSSHSDFKYVHLLAASEFISICIILWGWAACAQFSSQILMLRSSTALASKAGAQECLMNCIALNLMWLHNNSMDKSISIIYLLRKMKLYNLCLSFVIPERKHICRLASRITRIVTGTGHGWRGTGSTADILNANFHLPPQDSSSKEVLTKPVLV